MIPASGDAASGSPASPAGEGWAILGGAGAGRVAGVEAPGNGLGTAPLDAHPDAMRATSTTAARRGSATGVDLSV